jgi:hypothetical protein
MLNQSSIRAVLALAFAGGVLACSDSGTEVVTGPPTKLQATTQTQLSGTVGTSIKDAAVVKLTDAQGHPIPSGTVTWRLDCTGCGAAGTLSASQSLTGSDGVARVDVTLGTKVGQRQLIAESLTAAGPTQVVVGIDVAAAAPAAVVTTVQAVNIAQGQTRSVGATATDAYGNPVRYTWSTANSSVATVDSTGKITAVNPGTATLTASAGTVSTNVAVTVRAPLALPPVINECETNNARICGTWTLSGGQYNAVWSQGTQAVITVVRFDADSVVFTRKDVAGPSVGITARYSAGQNLAGTIRNALVRWTSGATTFGGTWDADW